MEYPSNFDNNCGSGMCSNHPNQECLQFQDEHKSYSPPKFQSDVEPNKCQLPYSVQQQANVSNTYQGPPAPQYYVTPTEPHPSAYVVQPAGHYRADGYVPAVQHQSFVGHIVLSCIVFWCCGWICGGIAFLLASKYMNFF